MNDCNAAAVFDRDITFPVMKTSSPFGPEIFLTPYGCNSTTAVIAISKIFTVALPKNPKNNITNYYVVQG